ncbi:MAG: putative cupredoxin-like copper-binding protein [Verrucomicrobiales bacterium]|jgi:uncharacterized cupredoxin-like copper-binding protein
MSWPMSGLPGATSRQQAKTIANRLLSSLDIEALGCYLWQMMIKRHSRSLISGWVVMCSGLLMAAVCGQDVQVQPVKLVTPRDVTIETVPGRLMFSPRSVQVQPGELLRLKVKNTGSVIHNFVICSEGVDNWKEVANLVIDLGDSMLARNFDPGPPLVTHSTALVRPGEEVTLNWKAPMAEGVYAFLSSVPGHVPLMRGEFQVSSTPVGLTDIRYYYYQGKWGSEPDFEKTEALAGGPLDGSILDFDAIPELGTLSGGRKSGEKAAVVITADITVKLPGDYTFSLTSAAPALLSISDGEVVMNEGKSTVTRFGAIELGSPEPTDELPHLRLQVISDAELATPRLSLNGPSGHHRLSAPGAFVIAPEVPPFTVTVPMPEASALALAVALPGDTNYCFDPESLSVRYAWLGGFIDARPVDDDGSGRPGGNVSLLGEMIPLGADGAFPLRIGSLAEDPPEVRYLGHTVGDGTAEELPALMFQVGDYSIAQKVSVSSEEKGSPVITYTFAIDPLPAAGVPIVFSADPDSVTLTTENGFARNGIAVLTSAPNESEVAVELRPVPQP